MKKLAVLISFFILAITYGQDKKTNEVNKKDEYYPLPMQSTSTKNIDNLYSDTIYNIERVSIKPEFKGGSKKIDDYISKKIEYSDALINESFKGSITALFIVEKDGSLTTISIVKNDNATATKEALRMLKAMPKWLPAELNGKKVRCMYTLSIYFDATKQ
jgi:hypothetical protein